MANNSIKISVIKAESTGRFATLPVSPKTSSILNILLQTIFPIAISDCLLNDAITEVTSSGALVPKATTVRPTIDSDTPNPSAMFFAEFTSKSAPSHNPSSHPTTRNSDFHSVFSPIWEFLSSLLDELFASQNVYEKKRIKKSKNTKDSHLVIIFTDPNQKKLSKARNNKANDAISEKGTSLYIVELLACSGYTIAATPSTSHVFAILDPMTFQSAKSVCPFIAESIFTKSSGALVPKATIVRPITRADIPKRFAILEAHSTRISAHLISTMNHITRYI